VGSRYPGGALSVHSFDMGKFYSHNPESKSIWSPVYLY
jgi:hypothetical protein